MADADARLLSDAKALPGELNAKFPIELSSANMEPLKDPAALHWAIIVVCKKKADINIQIRVISGRVVVKFIRIDLKALSKYNITSIASTLK